MATPRTGQALLPPWCWPVLMLPGTAADGAAPEPLFPCSVRMSSVSTTRQACVLPKSTCGPRCLPRGTCCPGGSVPHCACWFWTHFVFRFLMGRFSIWQPGLQPRGVSGKLCCCSGAGIRVLGGQRKGVCLERDSLPRRARGLCPHRADCGVSVRCELVPPSAVSLNIRNTPASHRLRRHAASGQASGPLCSPAPPPPPQPWTHQIGCRSALGPSYDCGCRWNKFQIFLWARGFTSASWCLTRVHTPGQLRAPQACGHTGPRACFLLCGCCPETLNNV